MAAKTKAVEAAQTAENVQADISPEGERKAENGGTTKASEAKETVTYTVKEFARAAATVFDKPVHQDIVSAAFKMAGKTEATKAEAAELVSKFLNKEVKVK